MGGDLEGIKGQLGALKMLIPLFVLSGCLWSDYFLYLSAF